MRGVTAAGAVQMSALGVIVAAFTCLIPSIIYYSESFPHPRAPPLRVSPLEFGLFPEAHTLPRLG